MLVIKRHRDEAFWVGQTRIVVVAVGEGKVRLAIDAPSGVQVLREELMVEKAGRPEPVVSKIENES